MSKKSPTLMRQIRHRRVRRMVRGTGERPRLAVFRSLRHIYAQVIDDERGITLVSANSKQVNVVGGEALSKSEIAARVGTAVAGKALEQGIKKVVFDRGGYRYHGRVKTLGDAAREAGLDF
ncbi:MAG TPA: 50S ribosomal protein L18 [Dehalococcoidia bacterium]|nr:50S ribosomal protein L18 [Dehalococcoidia bacterium]